MGNDEVGALRYRDPIIKGDYQFNFQTDWVLNPNNSAGVTVKDGLITITKVKPNDWFIKSNYGFTKGSERNEKFYLKNFNVQGVAEANSAGLFGSGCGCGYWSFNYMAYGLMIAPIQPGGLLLSMSYPWDMNIPGGFFKNPNYGAAHFGYRVNGDLALYNWNGIGYDSYPEVGLCIYSSGGALLDSDGYLNFETPITISSAGKTVMDPTTAEAWEVKLGGETLYSKEQTFQNAFMDFGIAYKETNAYSYGNQTNGLKVYESGWAESHGETHPVAFVISNKNWAASTEQYSALTIPYPTDLEEKLREGMPIKFWINQTDADIPGRKKFWENVIKFFRDFDIVESYGLTYLFSHSNISGAFDPTGDGYVTVNMNHGVYHAVLAADSIFDWSSVDKVRIRCKSGVITSLLNAFRQCRKLTDIQLETENDGMFNVHTWSGTFEYCSVPKFPENVHAYNGIPGKPESCLINYAFHGAQMPVIGNYEDEIVVNTSAMFAFDTWTGTEIKWILDMKIVNPMGNAQNVFTCPNLKKVKIKNLNKGVWSLDGTNHGVLNGNLPNLDADSVNYLVSNVYDLSQNSEVKETGDYTKDLFESSIYLCASMKSLLTESSLSIARQRGWNIYAGGELLNEKKPVNLKITTSGTLSTITVKDLDSDWSVTKTNVSQPTIEIPANVNNIEVDYLIDACVDQTGNTTGVGVTNIQPIYAGKKINQVHFTCTLDRSSSEHSVVNNWGRGPC